MVRALHEIAVYGVVVPLIYVYPVEAGVPYGVLEEVIAIHDLPVEHDPMPPGLFDHVPGQDLMVRAGGQLDAVIIDLQDVVVPHGDVPGVLNAHAVGAFANEVVRNGGRSIRDVVDGDARPVSLGYRIRGHGPHHLVPGDEEMSGGPAHPYAQWTSQAVHREPGYDVRVVQCARTGGGILRQGSVTGDVQRIARLQEQGRAKLIMDGHMVR
ncbi:MAG: hypothetical protein A4E29_01792 [Methanomassiliicoccales archaeon PtaB.Bin134]|nr:MAG: hypothetical protein A4E29_01792 [Methanomassiliicoccales archaeon PtaB.Bin134]